MKKLCLALLLAAGAPVIAPIHAQVSDPSYMKAVADYVQAADKETQGLRTEVDKLEREAKPERKAAFGQASGLVDKAEELVEQLKVASPRTFDTLKGRYERTRTDAMKALEKARQG